jgi:hypothetical protein
LNHFNGYHGKPMSDQDLIGDNYGDIATIEARLAELEQEKQHLIELGEQLRKAKSTASVPNSLNPEQKITIFSSLFRGRKRPTPLATD